MKCHVVESIWLDASRALRNIYGSAHSVEVVLRRQIAAPCVLQVRRSLRIVKVWEYVPQNTRTIRHARLRVGWAIASARRCYENVNEHVYQKI